MASNFALAKMYGAGQLSDSAAKSYGSIGGFVAMGASTSAQNRRKKLLEQNIKTGKLKLESLAPQDAKLLASTGAAGIHKSGGGGGFPGSDILGGIAGGIGNLGYDIKQWGRYAAPGALKIAGALWHDTHKPITLTGKDGGSKIYSDIVKPTAADYKERYSGSPGEILTKMYEHPLAPILDIATVGSLGGSAAARLGGIAVRNTAPGSMLSRVGQKGVSITSRGGRAPLEHPTTGRELPRQYTPRPVAKLSQKFLDLGTRTGAGENTMGKLVRNMEQRREARLSENEMQGAKYTRQGEDLKPMDPIAGLNDHEAMALFLTQDGINTVAKMDAWERMVKDTSLDNDEMMKSLRGRNVQDEYIKRSASIPPEVKELVLAPNAKMMEAHATWKNYVEKRREGSGITPKMEEAHFAKQDAQLEEFLQKEEGGDAGFEHPISKIYQPHEVASNFHSYNPNVLAKVLPDKTQAFLGITDKERFRRGHTDRSGNTGSIIGQNMFVPKVETFTAHSTGETFASGASRMDARLYLDHISRRAATEVENLWRTDTREKISYHDPESGEEVKFKNQDEINARFGTGKNGAPLMMAVNKDFPIAWYHNEVNHLEEVQGVIENYFKDHPEDADLNFDDPALEELVNKITDEDAKAFVKSQWGAMKRPVVAVPKDIYDYQLKMAAKTDPLPGKAGRFMVRAMHRWRAAVLTYMPRWALNTGVGGFLINTMRGVNLRDYYVSVKLQQAKLLPAGVRLGHQSQLDIMEAAAPGYGAKAMEQYATDMGIQMPGRQLLKGVQHIEDFFRQAQFVHNTRREVRLSRDANGRVVDLGEDQVDGALQGISDDMRKHEDTIAKFDGKMQEALRNPEILKNALLETNKLGYNYSILGPFERRILRQFVPFWGWYKFISMAVYRMPFEFPGRANAINALSQIAHDDEEALGPMPDWVKGSIPLGFGGGKLKYLPTLGLNPVSQIFNPMGPEGPLKGSLGLGQLNPAMQAAIQAFGLDTLTGDRVSISPESGVGEDPFGNLMRINPHTGEPESVSPQQVEGMQRFVMGLARSVPEYRLAERYLLNPRLGYGATYPESIPIVHDRPMAEAQQSGTAPVLGSMIGVLPREYDIGKFQARNKKFGKYSETRRKNALKKVRKLHK